MKIFNIITKTRLFKYIEKLISPPKTESFQINISLRNGGNSVIENLTSVYPPYWFPYNLQPFLQWEK